MLKSIKLTIKDSLIYGFGNIAVKIVGLILIPLYTNPQYFSTEEFGIIGILDISGLVLTTLLAFSLPHSFFRWYWDKDHRDNQKGLFFMTLVSQIVITGSLCLLLIPLSGNISGLLFNTGDRTKVITLVILTSAFQAINYLVSILLRLQSRSALFTFSNLFKLTTVLFLTLYLIIVKKAGIEGIYLAQVTGNVLYLLALSGYIIKNCKVSFNKIVLKEMHVYGFPLFLGSLATVFMNVVDRYSLNTLSVLRSVALYTLAVKLASVIKLVIVDSVKLTIMPIFMKKMDSPDSRRFHSKILLYTSFVVMYAIVGLSLFSLEITKIITGSRDFWNVVFIVPLLSLSIFFISMKEITVYGLYITKKSRLISYIIVSATILNIVLNIIFIPLWDITGAAVSTLLSQVYFWYMCHYFSQKEYHIPYETRKLVILFISGALFSLSGLLMVNAGLTARMVIKVLLVILFPFILYFLNFFEEAEINAVRGFVVKWADLRRLGDNLRSLKNITDDL